MSQTHRPSIRQKSITGVRDAGQWKDTLKQKCLDRVRSRRKRRLEEMRNARTAPLKRDSQHELDDSIDSEISYDESMQRTTARDVLNEQLMEESIHLRVLSTPQHNFSTDFTRTTPTSTDERMLFFSPVLTSNNIDKVDEMYCLTEDELFTLMLELDDEIQKEEDYLAEEFELMKKRQEVEEMLLLEQVESFEKLQIGNSRENLISIEASVESIPCPVCQSGKLSKGNKSERMYCSTDSCSLSRKNLPSRLEFGVNISIEELKQDLSILYEDHANHCHGLLRFQIGNLDGHDGLLVICTTCQNQDLVAACK